MKKVLIGAVVGGLIIFIWQFLSFALVNFHKPAQNYTDKQEAIMNFLNSQGLEEGGYVMPSLPESATMDEHNQAMKAAEGKPWAVLQYHSRQEDVQSGMIMNMIRGVLVNIVLVWLFCWIVSKMAVPSFNTILLASLATGLIVFFNAPYTGHIWYKTFDIWAFFMDAIVCWGLVGLWLGWWLRRGTARTTPVRTQDRRTEMVS